MKFKSLLLSTTLLCFTASAFAQLSFNDNIVSRWKLDETEGTTVTDDITGATGEITYGDGFEWVEGKLGNALDFTNSLDTSVVIIEDDGTTLDPINFTSESFSVSMWVKVDPSLNQFLMIHGDNGTDGPNGNGNRYAFETKDNEMRFVVDDDVTKTQLASDVTGLMTADAWAHVVGVRNRTEQYLYLYLDGTKIDELMDGTGDLNLDGQRLLIGNYHTVGSKVQGPMDDLMIINKALSDTEVQELYDSYATSGLYDMEVSGTSISSDNGTIVINVEAPAAVTVYSIDGKVVASQTVEETATISANAGIYVVIVDGETIKVMVK